MEVVSRADAKAAGLKRYFTGKPCKHGHVAERLTSSGACAECLRLGSLEWAKKNPEKHAAKARRYRSANPEQAADNERRWRQRNREKRASIAKSWSDRNLASVYARNAYRRALRVKATPPWADLNAIKVLYAEARRLTEETGIPHEVDHIFPLVAENSCGLHIASNLRVIPARENRKKSNKLPEYSLNDLLAA